MTPMETRKAAGVKATRGRKKDADRPLARMKRAAVLHKQLSDPTRRPQVILMPCDSGRHVGGLCAESGQSSQPAVSHHLALLKRGGIVALVTPDFPPDRPNHDAADRDEKERQEPFVEQLLESFGGFRCRGDFLRRAGFHRNGVLSAELPLGKGRRGVTGRHHRPQL
jgi:hypothetical protein